MSDKKAEKPVRFLIAGPKEVISSVVQSQYMDAKKQIGDQAPTPVYVDTVRAAQSKVSDRDFNYAGVFLNPNLGSPAWFAVVRTCHQYRPGVPVFIIHEENEVPKIALPEAKKLGLAGILPKPLTYAKMYEVTEKPPAQDESGFQEEVPQETPVDAKKGEEIQEADVLEVDLRNMDGRAQSAFDLYMRLSNKKYVKILNAGDMLSKDRVESYSAKGVDHLYILKSAQNSYLEFFDKMVAEVIKDDKVSVEVKTAQVASQGESTLAFLGSSGFSDASIEVAQKYVANTTEVIHQIAAKSDKVQELLKDVAAYDHSVAVTTMAGLVMKHIGGQTSLINAIGIACFMHDLPLVGMGPVMLEEDESKMTPDQLITFYAHPEEGARMVKKMKHVPPIVVTAVAQHHLRRGKQGFPIDKQVDEVNLISELIGLSQDFLKYVRVSTADPKVNPIAIMKEKAAKDYSAPLLDAFIRTFDER